MKLKIINPFVLLIIAGALVFNPNVSSSSSVEWSVLQTLHLEVSAIDVAMSPDGRLFFVLTEEGEIVIYSSPTTVDGKIKVGKHVDQIRVGPRGDSLVLNDRENKTVQVITLDFIKNINVSGSPSKGPEDAPVAVAVFSDFE